MKGINTQPRVVLPICNLKALKTKIDLKKNNGLIKELDVNSAQTATNVGKKSSSISFKVTLPAEHFHRTQTKKMKQNKKNENMLKQKQQNPIDTEMTNMSNAQSSPISYVTNSADQGVFTEPKNEIKQTTAVATDLTEIPNTMSCNKIDLTPKNAMRIDNTTTNIDQSVPEKKGVQPISDRNDVAETLMALRNNTNTVEPSIKHNLPLPVIPDRIKYQRVPRISPIVTIKNSSQRYFNKIPIKINKPNCTSTQTQTDNVNIVTDEQHHLLKLIECNKKRKDIVALLKADNTETRNNKRRLTYSEVIEIDDEEEIKEINPEAKDALESYSERNKNIINTIYNLTAKTMDDSKSETAIILNSLLDVNPEKAKAVNCLLKKILELVSDKEFGKKSYLKPITELQTGENATSPLTSSEKNKEINTNAETTNNVVKEVLRIMNLKSIDKLNSQKTNESTQTVMNDHSQQYSKLKHNQNDETQMNLKRQSYYQMTANTTDCSSQIPKKDVNVQNFKQNPLQHTPQHTMQHIPQHAQQLPPQVSPQHNTQHSLQQNPQVSQQHPRQQNPQTPAPPLQQLKAYTQNIGPQRVPKVNQPRPSMPTVYPKKYAARHDSQHLYDTTQQTNFDYYNQQKLPGSTQQFMEAHWKAGYNYDNKSEELSQLEVMQRQQYAQVNQAQQSIAAGQWYAAQNQLKQQQELRANWEYYYGDWNQRQQ